MSPAEFKTPTESSRDCWFGYLGVDRECNPLLFF